MSLKIGQEIDGYRIRGILGRGGMGVVYEAEDIALSRPVALKAINPGLTQDELFIKRFQTEARVLAKVNSPYIVSVHALRKTDQGLFIVMEFVDGGTLADRIEEGALSVEESLKLIRQMLRAFEHAHEANVIHRDIKPANIMLTPAGTVKVTDFGLAKQSQPDMMSTVTQGVMGTLFYMSPEQVRGMGDVDHRSDLYSLGMTMYQMLAGCLPFKKGAGEFDIMRSIVDTKFPSPLEQNSACPRALSDIVMKMIEKDANDRFQGAGEVLKAIDRVQSGTEGSEDLVAVRSEASPSEPDAVSAKPVDPARENVEENRRTVAESTSRPVGNIGRKIGMGIGGVALVVAGIVFLPDLLGSQSDSAAGERHLSLSTIPDRAIVFVNNEQIGETPLDGVPIASDDENIAVRIQKAGFVTLDTTLNLALAHDLALTPVAFSSGDDPATETDNGPDTETPENAPAIENGQLSVNIYPDAEIRVGGRTFSAGESISAAVGTHAVRFRHPSYGEFEERITIRAGRITELTCFYESLVNIRATPVWGTVWLNDEASQFTTDTQLKLGPGVYDVSVRKFGYESERIEGPAEPIQVRPSCGHQEKFDYVFKLTQP